MSRLQTNRIHQAGTSLLVAMVALVAMMTAGMALMRSVDSANQVAANFAMQQSASQNVDMALNEAMLAYLQSHPTAALNMLDRNNNTPGVSYWAVQQPQGGEGLPTALTALAAPGWDANGPVATGWAGEQIDAQSRQLRRYFVERLCNAAGVATVDNCQMFTLEYPSNGGKGTGTSDSDNLPYIRITVRVDGPKGAVSYAQMFMKGE